MDQNTVDGGVHLKKNTSPRCEFHPLQTPKYYCSDSKCRTSLCLICIKTHPKEHLPNLATIQDIKSQTLDFLKKEAFNRFDKFFNDILKSNKMNDLFKEAFGNLMQQNNSVDLDDEDVADILADTLQRQYFEKGIVIAEEIEEEISVKPSKSDLIAFDYQFHNNEYADEHHERNKRQFCDSSAEFYCKKQLKTFYAESKGQVIFWSIKDQTLLCKDLINPEKSKKYKVPLPFRFLTVLESEEKLLVVTESKNKLSVYSIEEGGTLASKGKEESLKSQKKEDYSNSNSVEDEDDDDEDDYFEDEDDSVGDEDDDVEKDEFLENYLPLKICSEFSLEEKIVFLESDHVNHLFVVTKKKKTLTANIYSVSHGLEFSQLLSFEPFGLPKKVVFDRVNNLLFILSSNILEIYKYHSALATSLQIISKISTTDFRWHQTTKRLLLVDSKKLYQLSKGKFSLLRVISDSEINILGLTSQGIFCGGLWNAGLFLLLQNNPNQQKDLILPSFQDQMDRLQEESKSIFFHGDSDESIDSMVKKLEIICNTVEILAETSDSLLVYANVEYYQQVKLKFDYDYWENFGGTIFTQHLLRYNITQRKYKIMGKTNHKNNHDDEDDDDEEDE